MLFLIWNSFLAELISLVWDLLSLWGMPPKILFSGWFGGWGWRCGKCSLCHRCGDWEEPRQNCSSWAKGDFIAVAIDFIVIFVVSVVVAIFGVTCCHRPGRPWDSTRGDGEQLLDSSLPHHDSHEGTFDYFMNQKEIFLPHHDSHQSGFDIFCS